MQEDMTGWHVMGVKLKVIILTRLDSQPKDGTFVTNV